MALRSSWSFMSSSNELIALSRQTESVLGTPFEWCPIPGGTVTLLDASGYGDPQRGTTGGTYQVANFAIAKYLLTNGQYQKFIDHPEGFRDPQWWEFSPQGI